MDINKLMEGLVFHSFGGYCGFDQLAIRFNNPKLKYIRGFVVNYINGYMTISGGGGASGSDISRFYLLDGNGNILWEDSYLD